jgi:hypothetical protein
MMVVTKECGLESKQGGKNKEKYVNRVMFLTLPGFMDGADADGEVQQEGGCQGGCFHPPHLFFSSTSRLQHYKHSYERLP